MVDTTTHTGGCHCGKVRFEAAADIGKLISCNCSICSKHGLLLTFIPAASFKLLSGENDLGDYQFARKTIHHRFCLNCGVETFGSGRGPDGTEMVAINVRCLDDIDFASLKPTPFDGRSL